MCCGLCRARKRCLASGSWCRRECSSSICAGDTRTPSVLNLIVFWATQIPLAWLLASSLALGPNGVFWAIVISESLLTVLGVLVFRRGAWRLKQV